MDLNINLETLAKAINGRVIKGSLREPFRNFETDNRKLTPGAFFWALKGEKHDAHEFLAQTLLQGTKGWIVEDAKINAISGRPDCVIGVYNTSQALQKLAAWHRARFKLPVTAITGSNGKSSTKEMLRSIFSRAGAVCSNKGNLNNHFGLPLSLMELNESHKYGVFELGASKKGDIFEIGSLAKPSIAVITNIGPSHLEYFGDMETVYKTKTELLSCLATGGTLIYNADDKYLARLKDTAVKKLSFGYTGADIRIADTAGIFSLGYKNDTIEIKLPSVARHDYYNAAAAAGAALACGLDLPTIKAGLEGFTAAPMRMQVLDIKGAKVVLDAYNANPASMRSALETVSGEAFVKPLYLALGDMKELGPESERYHTEIAAEIAKLDCEKVFLAGMQMASAARELATTSLAGKIVYAASPESWAHDLRAAIIEGKGTFLIKASRSMKFEKLIEGL